MVLSHLRFLPAPTNPSFQFEGDDSSEDEEGQNADELLGALIVATGVVGSMFSQCLDSAWKALEYARVTYEELKCHPIELSDVHLALGEFSQVLAC